MINIIRRDVVVLNLVILNLYKFLIKVKQKGLFLLDKVYIYLYKISVKLGFTFEIQKFLLPGQIYVRINPHLVNDVLNSNFKKEI
jgi:hypothetical protein